MQEWFNEAKGCKVEDETGNIYTLCDARRVGREWYLGLLPIGGPVIYVNIDRYDQLASVA